MIPLDIGDICGRLLDLRAYSATLSKKLEHEEELPEDAVPFLVERLQQAFARCESANAAERGEAMEELAHWLVKSHQFYLVRLLHWATEAPWAFRFPKAEGHYRH